MAYDPTKLVLRNSDLEGNAGGQLWGYTTASDSDATIVGAGYFSDGVNKHAAPEIWLGGTDWSEVSGLTLGDASP